MRRANPATPPRRRSRARTLGASFGGCQLPVEEHRHGELLGDPVGQHERLRARLAPPILVQVDDGGNVERADMGVLTGLRVALPRRPHHVDLLDGDRAPRRIASPSSPPDAASVNTERLWSRVAVGVQQPHAAASPRAHARALR